MELGISGIVGFLSPNVGFLRLGTFGIPRNHMDISKCMRKNSGTLEFLAWEWGTSGKLRELKSCRNFGIRCLGIRGFRRTADDQNLGVSGVQNGILQCWGPQIRTP